MMESQTVGEEETTDKQSHTLLQGGFGLSHIRNRLVRPRTSRLGRRLEELPCRQTVWMSAAVLIPLIERPHGLSVILTKRTEHLSHHAGQISFPGGRIEAEDDSPLAAALREAEEEVGLTRSAVEILGCLPDYKTGTGFHITPVVGGIHPPVAFSPDPFEVADLFEVPLTFFLDPSNLRQFRYEAQGQSRDSHAFSCANGLIWGATAGMLVELCALITDNSDD